MHGRDALAWIGDTLSALASLVLVIGGIAGTRYLRRANVRLADCELAAGRGGWLILRASAQIENKGFLRIGFADFDGKRRPRITVAETVDVPAGADGGRQITEVRTWTAYDLESDIVDPGEMAAWTEVFHLDPPTPATVGYRVTTPDPGATVRVGPVGTARARRVVGGRDVPRAQHTRDAARTLNPWVKSSGASRSTTLVDPTELLTEGDVRTLPDGGTRRASFYVPSTPTYVDEALLKSIDAAAAPARPRRRRAAS